MSLAVVGGASAAAHATSAHFVPLGERCIFLDETPNEAVRVAIRRFNSELERMTGRSLTVRCGGPLRGQELLHLDPNVDAATLQEFSDCELPALNADALDQAYVLLHTEEGPSNSIELKGFSQTDTPRGTLGLSYGLAELLKRLTLRDGVWGFMLSDLPLSGAPAMANRTVYLMNSDRWYAPGVSFDYGDHAQLEKFVDALIAARFSRIAFWQWNAVYLYPGNHEDRRADNLRIHQGMRYLLDYGRQRGLEIIHMLTPMHANPDLLPDDPKYVATGYYGRTSVCWAQPEARELAREMARHEMDYYGPVDGYVCWFYDPGGCFCDECRANQGQYLLEQFLLVKELAGSISPGAEMQACLWPTWCFHETQWGIDFPKDDVESFVKEFLAGAHEACGTRQLTILDSCDTTFTNYEFNIYSGIADAKQFKRNGFMHRVLGTPGEASYVFAPFGFRFLQDPLETALDEGLDEAMLSVIYTTPSYPSLHAFGEQLYFGMADSEIALAAYAATVAKGEAYPLMVDLLTALEDRAEARSYEAMDTAIARAEQAWEALAGQPHLYANREWLDGYVGAQRLYYQLARATTESEYVDALANLRGALIENPTYTEYVKHSLTPQTIARLHVPVWRGQVGDSSRIGMEQATADKWIGVPDVYKEDP